MGEGIPNFFSNSGVGADVLVYFLLGLTAVTFLIIYSVYRYRRFKRYQEFVAEMKQFQLDEEQENTLAQMVKSYALEEPVEILLSLRKFDELAQKEIAKVLGSTGSVDAKKKFINLVYDIRRKTYFPDYLSMNTTDSDLHPEHQ